MNKLNDDYDSTERIDRPVRRNNWWPLLLLPVFFLLGWAGNDTLGTASQLDDGRVCDLNTPGDTSQISR